MLGIGSHLGPMPWVGFGKFRRVAPSGKDFVPPHDTGWDTPALHVRGRSLAYRTGGPFKMSKPRRIAVRDGA